MDCQEVEDYINSHPDECDDDPNNTYCKEHDYCNCYYHDWIINLGLIPNLFGFYFLNYLFTICAVTLSYPCGLFSPVFTLGSVFGRIYGELFRDMFSYCDPRVYSVVGAAAMAAGVTQTISPAVIALEVTQDLSLAVPCLLAVILSGGISGTLTHSFYDSVLQLRGIPMLPIRPTVAYKRILIKPRKKYTSRSRAQSQRTMSPRSLINKVRSESFSDSALDMAHTGLIIHRLYLYIFCDFIMCYMMIIKVLTVN